MNITLGRTGLIERYYNAFLEVMKSLPPGFSSGFKLSPQKLI